MTHAHLVNPLNPIPNWNLVSTTFPYQEWIKPLTACDHEYESEKWQMFETYDDEPWTDSLTAGGIEIVEGTKEITYNMRLMDGIPHNVRCDQVLFYPIKPRCPSVAALHMTINLTAAIETNSPGYDRLRLWYTPPYNRLVGTDFHQSKTGLRILGTEVYSYPARWHRTHKASTSQVEATGYTPLENTTAWGEANGSEYEISDWDLQSQRWTLTDDDAEKGDIADNIEGKLVSDDGEMEGVVMQNTDSCPGFIIIEAATRDRLWQLDGGIFYQLELKLHEIDH